MPNKEPDDIPPRDFMAYHFNRGKRVFAGSVTLEDVPGALASAANVLAGMKFNLVNSESQNVPRTNLSVWSFFAENGDKSVEMQKVLDEIRRVPRVVKANVHEGADGVVVSNGRYPLRFNTGEQALVFRRQNFAELIRRFDSVFGSGASVVFFEMGRTMGESDARILVDRLGKQALVRNLNELVHLISTEGWGVPELTELTLEPLRVGLRIQDSFECTSLKASRPKGHFFRGYLVGLSVGIFGIEVDCTEVRCASMGNPYCEFVVSQNNHRAN